MHVPVLAVPIDELCPLLHTLGYVCVNDDLLLGLSRLVHLTDVEMWLEADVSAVAFDSFMSARGPSLVRLNTTLASDLQAHSLQHCGPALQELVLLFNIVPEVLSAAVLPLLSCLRKLTAELGDNCLVVLGSCYPDLEEVSSLDSVLVSDAGVQAMAVGCPKLRSAPPAPAPSAKEQAKRAAFGLTGATTRKRRRTKATSSSMTMTYLIEQETLPVCVYCVCFPTILSTWFAKKRKDFLVFTFHLRLRGFSE